MTKFVSDKKELLELICNITKKINPDIKPSDIEPILNNAIFNFQREMKMEYDDLVNLPDDIKGQMFQILIKHLVINMQNDPLIMEDRAGELTQLIERNFK